MSVYTNGFRVRASDVDMYRRLRLSTLFTLLQEASIAHTEQLGMGREKTFDKGLLWVVTLQYARIRRLPVFAEDVILASWPGKTMHVLFPRYYRLEDAKGELLLEASALWALMDAATRRTVFPEEHGVGIGGVITGSEPPLPRPPRSIETDAAHTYPVPYSSVDLNGHMNNARYFDLAEDLMPGELRSRALREVTAEYAGEALPEDRIAVSCGRSGDEFFVDGKTEKRLFRMRMRYESTRQEA